MLSRRHIAPAKRDPNIFTDRISVLIPAAGIGKRMKYCGPKCLLQLPNHTTVLEQQITNILSVYPNADIVITIGFAADKIYKTIKGKYNVRLVYNQDYETNNVVHSLSLALYTALSDKVLIIYGDLVFNKETITNIAISHHSKLLIDTQSRLNDSEVGLVSQNHIATNLAYGIPNKWAQIAFITNNELSLLEKSLFNVEHKNWFGYEALNYIIENGGNFETYEPPNMSLTELDTPKDLEKLYEIPM